MARFSLSKEEYLLKRISGQSRKNIAQEQDIGLPGLDHWLKKWGIKDPLLEEVAMEEYATTFPGPALPMKQEPMLTPDIQAAAKNLFEAAPSVSDEASSAEAAARLIQQEVERSQQKDAEIDRL
ncbi:MAG: hypothetical protein K6T85_03085, partial [Gorillibacterium sp.]|nr:hypothetical protein [Gorillibacterium sp.]